MTNKRGHIYQRNVRHAYIFLRRHFGSCSTRSGSFIFKMAEMLQIPRVFPLVSCLGSSQAVQCPRPEPKMGDKSPQIPRYSSVCPRGQPLRMAADKCIRHSVHTYPSRNAQTGKISKSPAFYFHVDGKHFRKRCCYDGVSAVGS